MRPEMLSAEFSPVRSLRLPCAAAVRQHIHISSQTPSAARVGAVMHGAEVGGVEDGEYAKEVVGAVDGGAVDADQVVAVVASLDVDACVDLIARLHARQQPYEPQGIGASEQAGEFGYAGYVHLGFCARG